MTILTSNDRLVLKDLANSYAQCLNSRATGFHGEEWINHWQTIDCDGKFFLQDCLKNTRFMQHIIKILVAGLAHADGTEERVSASKACMLFQKLYSNDNAFKRVINAALNHEASSIAYLEDGSPFSSIIYAHAIIQEAREEYTQFSTP
ncbi:MAG: hypothetical protein P1U32_05205 [Legionellaceae bacterium]|nr:hypothetical protein [Legionellaceae bacterium]